MLKFDETINFKDSGQNGILFFSDKALQNTLRLIYEIE